MNQPQARLDIRRERAGDDDVLWLSGELDMACAGQLETAIGELCADGCRRLVVEMAELDFMDSTGLRSLLVGRELCEVNGCELLIGSVSPQVARLLEVSGVSGQMAWREPERADS
jgi:anti-sigma B factor antagonist